MVWCGPLHLAFPGDVADTCTNIQQVVSKEEEEEEGIPHIDTEHNARMWVDLFGGLHEWQDLWYMGEKYDNKEWDLNYEHPFPRVLGY